MSAKLNQTSAALESAPGTMLRLVTPSDTVALPLGPCRALIAGTSGTLAVIAEDDSTAVTITGVQAGQVIPVRAKLVMNTNTTCTAIVAIY